MRPMLKATLLCAAALVGIAAAPAQRREPNPGCDRICLEKIGDQYRAAYLAHDPSKAPISRRVRFSENFVEMPFPDATWDTVTAEVGEPLTLSDPVNGQVGIYTRIMQNDTPGYLAVRLKVEGELVTEIEHVISTKRNLSAPPTPIADFDKFQRSPHLNQPVPKAKCRPRAEMVRLADGYFETLENNNGEIRGTRFSPTATRTENGLNFPEIEKGFKSGRYLFNERVRDRDLFLVDEYRCMVMARGFIDHKGVMDQYTLTDGTPARSIFREPHSWALLESFKLEDGMITGVEAVFIASAYNMRAPWTVNPDVIRSREAKYPKK
ncbi:hypothetical protein [Sphingomonas sp. Y38-1Y]|uniref:hypothetical protein n=1 Tax=Sphingomonas sp. Y38-1Y TaxID=3078265 RepID=UPI0028E904D7|nr:hypothetical protein [Sphingomonas sp. Y38-1Y]